jgi:hypothetical protein
MRRAALVTCALVLASAGCGSGDDRDQASAVAGQLYAAVRAGDGAQACAQLSPKTREALERDESKACPEAIEELDLSGGELGAVSVYETDARVIFKGGDTVFLDRTPEGWRVSAAGCKPKGELPAECEVES